MCIMADISHNGAFFTFAMLYNCIECVMKNQAAERFCTGVTACSGGKWWEARVFKPTDREP